MGVRELRDNLGRQIDAAHREEQVTVVTKSGKPRAVLVPYEWYRQRRDRPL